MTGSRRDLLRLFGIGSVIVPMLDGQPQDEARSVIISPPQVRPVPSKTLSSSDANGILSNKMLGEGELWDTTMYMKRRNGSEQVVIKCSSIIMQWQALEFGPYSHDFIQRTPAHRAETMLKVTGEIYMRDWSQRT